MKKKTVGRGGGGTRMHTKQTVGRMGWGMGRSQTKLSNVVSSKNKGIGAKKQF